MSAAGIVQLRDRATSAGRSLARDCATEPVRPEAESDGWIEAVTTCTLLDVAEATAPVAVSLGSETGRTSASMADR